MKTIQTRFHTFGCLSVFIALIAMQVCYGMANKSEVKKPDPNTLAEAFTPLLVSLYRWPDQAVLTGQKRVENDANDVLWPKNQCTDWLHKVLEPAWLPPENTELIFLRGEFEGRDTVRLTWERNGYGIQLTQTASIFAIKLTPLEIKGTGKDPAEKTGAAKQLCLRIFNKEAYRWSRAGKKVPVKTLNKKIAAYSFRPELTRELKGDRAVRGRPQSVHEAGVRQPTNDQERIQERDPNNPNWVHSWVSYNYWFRKINWWNDGNSVGFFFLKIEEGAWVPSYNASFDRTFFRK